MSRMGKLGAAILLTASAAILAIGGQLGIAVLLWGVMVFYLLKLDLAQIKQTLDRYEAKVFFCMEPELYLAQLEAAKTRVLFKSLFEPVFRVLEAMGRQFVMTSENMEKSSSPFVISMVLEWPWSRMAWVRERLLLIQIWESLNQGDLKASEHLFEKLGEDWRPEALQYRLKHYRLGLENHPKLQMKLLDQSINKGDYYPFGDEFIWNFGLVCRGRWLMLNAQYDQAEQLLSQLRSEEPYNLLFGEINLLLGDVYWIGHKDVETAQNAYETALNFAEGLKLQLTVELKLASLPSKDR